MAPADSSSCGWGVSHLRPGVRDVGGADPRDQDRPGPDQWAARRRVGNAQRRGSNRSAGRRLDRGPAWQPDGGESGPAKLCCALVAHLAGSAPAGADRGDSRVGRGQQRGRRGDQHQRSWSRTSFRSPGAVPLPRAADVRRDSRCWCWCARGAAWDRSCATFRRCRGRRCGYGDRTLTVAGAGPGGRAGDRRDAGSRPMASWAGPAGMVRDPGRGHGKRLDGRIPSSERRQRSRRPRLAWSPSWAP